MINTFSELVTVKRQATNGKYIKGNFHSGREELMTISACIQPADGKTLLLLPEGERNKESIDVYTECELLSVDPKTGRKSDIIIYKNKEYEIQIIKAWTQLIPHFQAVAVLVNKKDGD